MRGIDRERGEDGEDAVLERVAQRGAVVGVELGPIEEVDADVLERRGDVLREDRRLALDQLPRLVADRADGLGRVEAVGRPGADPASTCSWRPDTRTWKYSSRFEEKIARNFARSRSGRAGSSARARTRALKSSHDSSRFRNRPGRERMSLSRPVMDKCYASCGYRRPSDA